MESWSIGISVLAFVLSAYSVIKTRKLQNLQEKQLRREVPDIEPLRAERDGEWVTYYFRNNLPTTIRGNLERTGFTQHEWRMGAEFISLHPGGTGSIEIHDESVLGAQPQDVTIGFGRGRFRRWKTVTVQLPSAD